MPRRRMIGPEFWDDEYIGRLSDTLKLAIIGCVGNADDEGRLKGSGAYLKAAIFMYDDEKTAATVIVIKDQLLDKMESWPKNHPYRMVSYQNGDADYLSFPNWQLTNKPSHPSPSKLPVPPLAGMFENTSGETPEELPNLAGDTPSQVRSGQSSLGKVRLGQEDFANLNEKELTDRLRTTLTEVLPAGPQQTMASIKSIWRQVTGIEMDSPSFQMIYDALKKYDTPQLAVCIAKSARYSVGKKKPASYIKTIFDEHGGVPREHSP